MWASNEFIDLVFKADPNDPRIFEKLRIAGLLVGYSYNYTQGLKDCKNLKSYSDFEDRVRNLIKVSYIKYKNIKIKFSNEELDFLIQQKPSILSSNNIDFTEEQLNKILLECNDNLVFELSPTIFTTKLYDKKYFDIILTRFGISSLFRLYPGVRLPKEYQKEYVDSVLSDCIQNHIINDIILDEDIQWQLFIRNNNSLNAKSHKNYDFITFNIKNTNKIIKYLANHYGEEAKRYIERNKKEIPFHILSFIKGEKFSETMLNSI